MALTRTTLGRLAAYQASPISGVTSAFDAGDWAAPTGITMSVASGRLRAVGAVSTKHIRLTALATREDAYLRVHSESTGISGQGGGPATRVPDASDPNSAIALQIPINTSAVEQLLERSSGSIIQTDQTAATNRSSPVTRSLLWVRSTLANAKVVGFTARSLTGIALTGAGRAAWYHSAGTSQNHEIGGYDVSRSALLIVEGPVENDWKVQVRGAGSALIAEAPGVDGVATIDDYALNGVLGAGALTIQIRDLSDNLLESEPPSEHVWPGDVWSYAPDAAPDTPTGLAVGSIGATSASLSWDAVTGADGYRLYRSLTEVGGYTLVADLAGTDTADGPLEPLTQYFWRVAAYNDVGESDPSSAVNATTLEAVPDIPAAPSVAALSNDSLQVTWSAVPYATGYDVYRSLTEFGGYALVGSGAATSFIDTELEPSTRYYYRISACSGAGCSDLSAAGSAVTAGLRLHADCTLLLEVFEDDGETLAWAAASDPAHPNPFLSEPSHYGAREIDPIGGAASIGTVDVTLVDPAQIAGDQESGWMTERLPTIYGRRARLRRYVNPDEGYFVIADGPASAPRMNDTYASFTFAIRDVRETERRLRPFSSGGTSALCPRGSILDWGTDPDTEGPLLEAVAPLVGRTAISFNVSINRYVCSVMLSDYFDFLTTPGTIYVDPLAELSEDAVDAMKAATFGALGGFPQADVLWRFAGNTTWNVARPALPALFAQNIGGITQGVDFDTGRPRDGLSSVLLYAEETIPAGMPDDDDLEVEVVLRHRASPTAAHPYYFEGTLGALLTQLYDRQLERAPDLGGLLHDPLGLDDAPTGAFGGGIRVDQDALDAIDVPVLLRQVEAIDDGRDWAERQLYAPSGYIPSLDAEGRISPVSRARPQVVPGPLIDDEVAEPSSDWNAGERVVTAVRFTYQRYFKPSSILIAREPDGLAVRDVVIEYRDPAAEQRHGEQLEDFDASAFGAVGTGGGLGIAGAPDVAAVLASRGRFEVLERYRNGAQAIRVNVRRAGAPGLRDGIFLPVELRQFPNFSTGRRGMNLAAAQVLSLEQLGCEWLTLLVEEVPIAAPPGYYFDLEKTEDTPDPGYFIELELTGDDPAEDS